METNIKENNYYRISVSVLLEMTVNNEKSEFSNRMRNKIYEISDSIREKIILKINEFATGKWHIHFGETPENKFILNIYTENNEDYEIAKRTVREQINNKIDSIYQKTFSIENFILDGRM